MTYREAMEEASRRCIDQALKNNHGNVAAAARELGLARQTMHVFVKRHNLKGQGRYIRRGNRGNDQWQAMA